MPILFLKEELKMQASKVKKKSGKTKRKTTARKVKKKALKQSQQIALPNELWDYVLSFVDQKTLTRTTLVCSLWHSLSKEHLNKLSQKNATIFASKQACFRITKKGEVYACGKNDFYQLALPRRDNRYTSFQKIPELKNIINIAISPNFGLAVTKKGDVYTWGRNLKGQLGLGDIKEETKLPTKIPSLQNIKYVTAASHKSYAVDADDQVFVWGEIKLGNIIKTPQKITQCYIKNSNTTMKLPTIKKIVANSCFTYALTKNGYVLAWQELRNGEPQLAKIPNLENIVDITPGNGLLIALSNQHEVSILTHTSNTIMSHIPLISPTLLTGLKDIVAISAGGTDSVQSLALDKQGHVYSLTLTAVALFNKTGESSGSFKKIRGLKNVSEIAAGVNHSLVVTNDGKLFTLNENLKLSKHNITVSQENNPRNATKNSKRNK